jgi:hypothetical protein
MNTTGKIHSYTVIVGAQGDLPWSLKAEKTSHGKPSRNYRQDNSRFRYRDPRARDDLVCRAMNVVLYKLEQSEDECQQKNDF